jgi:hypothetical protein
MHHNLLGRTVYNRTTDFFTPCFMTLSYDVTKQVTCIRRTVVGSRDSATGQRHYSCRQPLVCLHVRKDPLGLLTCDRIKFSKIVRSVVSVIFCLSQRFKIYFRIYFSKLINPSEKQKTAARGSEITKNRGRYLSRFAIKLMLVYITW